jgi:copper(I)-binding protein
MLLQPKRSLHPGDHVEIILQFVHGSPIDVDFVVPEEVSS